MIKTMRIDFPVVEAEHCRLPLQRGLDGKELIARCTQRVPRAQDK